MLAFVVVYQTQKTAFYHIPTKKRVINMMNFKVFGNLVINIVLSVWWYISSIEAKMKEQTEK